ncbi:MAG TPA: bifunctional 5,10-methylenetetrahydrofolate dehydrogenase/5,10-methenyltetrahydrofolate cyclohydrolase [Streptosporangiaceae bacterium]|jgi:methylenetetrahydrofolate dehydrogenase (NADP+)/methenyltetrahydrofolate cyclohydrolase
MPQAALMNGTALAAATVAAVASRAARFTELTGAAPCLATVLVGDDPASATYVKMKQSRCRQAGLDSRHVPLPAQVSTEALIGVISGLSADDGVHGILLQHPVPRHIDEQAAFDAISPDKDVDGVTMHSFAAIAFGRCGFTGATPGGIMRLLDAYDVKLSGQHTVVIGRSPILGKPAGMLLLGRDATVTYCHSKTEQLPEIVRTADIVVAAVGRAEFVRGGWLKPGAVVIDAGYSPGPVGDVAFAEAVEVASLITPVPGGVGPMTLAVLLDQTVSAAFDQAGLPQP